MAGFYLRTRNLLVLFLWILAGAAVGQELEPAKGRALPQDTTGRRQTNQQQTHGQLSPFEQPVKHAADLEVDGLIVDETLTKVGRDFYEVFHRQWEAPPAASNYTILIKELPARGNSSIVSLSVNEEKLFEQAMQPRYDVIEETATYLAAAVYEYLLSNQLNEQLEAEGKRAREVF